MNGGPGPDRLKLLRTAAAVLLSRMPTWQALLWFEGRRYRARFSWPGVVSVADDNTGDVVALSLPGQPTEPDADTLAKPRIVGRP